MSAVSLLAVLRGEYDTASEHLTRVKRLRSENLADEWELEAAFIEYEHATRAYMNAMGADTNGLR